MFTRFFSRCQAYFLCAAMLTACGMPAADPTSAQGKRAILDDVNIYLSAGNCSAALNEILPLYNSTNTDNDVRMAMASVYGCNAGFNFFGFFSKVGSLNFSNNALFELFATEFPSQNVLSDKVVESAGFGIDALMAILAPGQVLIPGDLFNTTTNNQGSLLFTDRTFDANLYSFFITMTAMGGLENRVGAAANGAPLNSPPLPWITSSTAGMATAAGLTASGCEYASALVNVADATAQISTQCLSGSAAPAVTNVPAFVVNKLNCLVNLGLPGESFSQMIYDACNFGCQGKAPTVANGFSVNQQTAFDPLGGWSAATCGASTFCTQCPLLLRNRNNCAGTANDQTSCAAAGIINFANNALIGWQ
jgi:hypothetical protein